MATLLIADKGRVFWAETWHKIQPELHFNLITYAVARKKGKFLIPEGYTDIRASQYAYLLRKALIGLPLTKKRKGWYILGLPPSDIELSTYLVKDPDARIRAIVQEIQ